MSPVTCTHVPTKFTLPDCSDNSVSGFTLDMIGCDCFVIALSVFCCNFTGIFLQSKKKINEMFHVIQLVRINIKHYISVLLCACYRVKCSPLQFPLGGSIVIGRWNYYSCVINLSITDFIYKKDFLNLVYL